MVKPSLLNTMGGAAAYSFSAILSAPIEGRTSKIISSKWQTPTDNGVRVKVLAEIVRFMQAKKPSWAKNRVLHLATQLEEALYEGELSLEQYKETATLVQRVERQCYLLGTKKKVTHKTPLERCSQNFVNVQQDTERTSCEGGVTCSDADTKAQQPPADVAEEDNSHAFGDYGLADLDPTPYITASSLEQDLENRELPMIKGSSVDRHLHARVKQDDDCKALFSPDKKRALHSLQNRLMLLVHANTCQEQASQCQVYNNCCGVRALLEHIKGCQARQGCKHPHCTSSRCLLAHHGSCQSPVCDLCRGARDAIQSDAWLQRAAEHRRQLEECQAEKKRKREAGGPGSAEAKRRALAKKAMQQAQLADGIVGIDSIGPGFFLRQAEAAKKAGSSKAPPGGADTKPVDPPQDNGANSKSPAPASRESPRKASLAERHQAEEPRGDEGDGEESQNVPPRCPSAVLLGLGMARAPSYGSMLESSGDLQALQSVLQGMMTRAPSFVDLQNLHSAMAQDGRLRGGGGSCGNLQSLVQSWMGEDGNPIFMTDSLYYPPHIF